VLNWTRDFPFHDGSTDGFNPQFLTYPCFSTYDALANSTD
jgi:hypothetical protein